MHKKPHLNHIRRKNKGYPYPKIHSFQYNILSGKLLVEIYKIIHNLGVANLVGIFSDDCGEKCMRWIQEIYFVENLVQISGRMWKTF